MRLRGGGGLVGVDGGFAQAQGEAIADLVGEVGGGQAGVVGRGEFQPAIAAVIQIVDGLQEGDRVVLSDLPRWQDAERIRIR